MVTLHWFNGFPFQLPKNGYAISNIKSDPWYLHNIYDATPPWHCIPVNCIHQSLRYCLKQVIWLLKPKQISHNQLVYTLRFHTCILLDFRRRIFLKVFSLYPSLHLFYMLLNAVYFYNQQYFSELKTGTNNFEAVCHAFTSIHLSAHYVCKHVYSPCHRRCKKWTPTPTSLCIVKHNPLHICMISLTQIPVQKIQNTFHNKM